MTRFPYNEIISWFDRFLCDEADAWRPMPKVQVFLMGAGTDVYPDGTAYNLADSCLRLRYRDGFEQPAKLVPGETYQVRIGGITTGNYFPAGHQIRIELATDGPIAHLTLHHGTGHESALHFRVYTGEITVNTPMSDNRSGNRP